MNQALCSTESNLQKLVSLNKTFLLPGFSWPLVKLCDEVMGNVDTEGGGRGGGHRKEGVYTAFIFLACLNVFTAWGLICSSQDQQTTSRTSYEPEYPVSLIAEKVGLALTHGRWPA